MSPALEAAAAAPGSSAIAPRPPYDRHTPLLPVWHQPALAAGLLEERGHTVREALASAKTLGPDRLADDAAPLSPEEWLDLLGLAERLVAQPDTAFVIGRRLLPGHYGAASSALAHAGSLRQALETLVAHPAALSPLLTPHLHLEAGEAVLVWTDAVGLGARRAFVVDMMSSAVVAMAHWLGGSRPDWTCCFNRAAPRQPEQHEAYLGGRLQFGCQADAIVMPVATLDLPWPAAQRPGQAAAQAAALRQAACDGGPQDSLLGVLHRFLLARVHAAPGLDAAASHLGISPATLKRRLAAEGTHFQAELDLVRRHVALQLYRYRGAANAAVAAELGFQNVSNYRRAFRRWTGATPLDVRAGLEAGPAAA